MPAATGRFPAPPGRSWGERRERPREAQGEKETQKTRGKQQGKYKKEKWTGGGRGNEPWEGSQLKEGSRRGGVSWGRMATKVSACPGFASCLSDCSFSSWPSPHLRPHAWMCTSNVHAANVIPCVGLAHARASQTCLLGTAPQTSTSLAGLRPPSPAPANHPPSPHPSFTHRLPSSASGSSLLPVIEAQTPRAILKGCLSHLMSTQQGILSSLPGKCL